MNSAPTRILVVEDDPSLRRFLCTSLDAHGYGVSEVATGQEALRRIPLDRPDVVVLDLGLPDLDGVDLVGRVREWSEMPIIVVSSRDSEASKIQALDRGADDYVTKPFSMGELLARIRAALRHRLRQQGVEPIWRSGPIEVDLTRREVRKDGAPVRLTPREYDLLRFFVVHADRVVTHEQVLKEVWGQAQIHETQYLRVFVGRLRQKIEPDPAQPHLLVTESGVGYRLRTLENA
jgi:two-component system, OmpR family, KDP operon response regulator KdpE